MIFIKDTCSRLENNIASPCPEDDNDVEDFMPAPVTSCEKYDKSTQRPSPAVIPYKHQSLRGQREIRSEITDTLRQGALKAVVFEETDLPQLITEIVGCKKWVSAFGVSSLENNPLLESLVKDYKECMSKEKAREIRKKTAAQKAKLLIGSSLKDSKLTLSGDKTPQEFKKRIVAAESIGRMTYFADECRRLLSVVAMDYTYWFLQESLVALQVLSPLQESMQSSLVMVGPRHPSASSNDSVRVQPILRNSQSSS